jgi:transcriptional regulator of acetoin/glycerol metabolism
MSAEYRRQDAIRNETAFATLAQCRGNRSRAAKPRGQSRNTLIARTDQHGLARPLPRRERS